jgi:tubulin-specific chaperone E
MASDIEIGKRLSYGGLLCTVRYIGTVSGTQGEWLGVEWDDPTRGKHSGEHNGVKYFDCRTPGLRNQISVAKLTLRIRKALAEL